MKKVSFDFDDTLEHEDVQKYAKELIDKGIEVWIVTTRWEDPTKYSFPATNDDLFEVAKKLGIPKEHIHFNNMKYKGPFLNGKEFVWHLDDNPEEVALLDRTDTTGVILWLDGSWEKTCNTLLA